MSGRNEKQRSFRWFPEQRWKRAAGQPATGISYNSTVLTSLQLLNQEFFVVAVLFVVFVFYLHLLGAMNQKVAGTVILLQCNLILSPPLLSI